LRPRIDLFLLRDSLSQLIETTYFTADLHEFTDRLLEVIAHVIQNDTRYGLDIVRAFAKQIRTVQTYLSGSTSKEAPYEMEYCLRVALSDWVKEKSIITTALTADQDFHFVNADPWAFIRRTIVDYDPKGYEPLLVLIGVPRLYRHKPIYCIPLYHELGHFIDLKLGVTNLSLLLSPPPAGASQELQLQLRRHRHEHFADLFAASYVGRASIGTLETIAPESPASSTHPATLDRVNLVESYLSKKTDPIITLFQQCLQHLNAPALTPKFTTTDIRPFFDDLRPYAVADFGELHGLFDVCWTYLCEALDRRTPPWSANANDGEIDRIINDLAEKSIRNMSIRERWLHGASSKT
jgi:hypothetical protein